MNELNRRGFLRGVIGGAAVSLIPAEAAAMLQLEPKKEILLPVTPEIVHDASSLLPPCRVTRWEIHDHKPGKPAEITMVAFDSKDDLPRLLEEAPVGGVVTWELPYDYDNEQPPVIVTGKVMEWTIRQEVSSLVEIRFVLITAYDNSGAHVYIERGRLK
jgi:hypothetical protein